MRNDIINLFKERNENIGAFCGYLKSKNGLKQMFYLIQLFLIVIYLDMMVNFMKT